jgi:hypothetical protein
MTNKSINPSLIIWVKFVNMSDRYMNNLKFDLGLNLFIPLFMCIPFFKLKSVFPSLTKTRLIPCSYTVLMGRREPIQFTFGLGPLHSKLPIGPVRGDMARSTQHNA